MILPSWAGAFASRGFLGTASSVLAIWLMLFTSSSGESPPRQDEGLTGRLGAVRPRVEEIYL
jgi:hypothetical protein